MNHLKAMFVTITVAVVMSGCVPTVTENKIPEPVAEDTGLRYTSDAPKEASFKDVRAWAEKYKQISKQNEQLKKQNQELTTDNTRLVKRFDTMRASLEETEGELSDANDMLIEMRKELDGWKANVLGFREESNYVHKEQLKALVKILKLLGAEYDDSQPE
jgi:septal ring factor EnvC (AmiA/AmiB activator)